MDEEYAAEKPNAGTAELISEGERRVVWRPLESEGNETNRSAALESLR